MGRPTRVARSKEEEEQVKNKLCAWCGKPLPEGRRSYCSDKCRNDYWLHHDWGWMREHIRFRDKYTCRQCGLKVEASGCGYVVTENPKNYPVQKYYNYMPLVVDHIIPVALAPEKWFDETNLQTLCKWCNRIKTKADMRRIRKHRNNFKPLLNPFNINIELPLKKPFVSSLEPFLATND